MKIWSSKIFHKLKAGRKKIFSPDHQRRQNFQIQQRYEDEINRARSCILAAREESKKLNDEIVTLQSHLEFTKTDAQAALQQQQILYEAEVRS